MGRANSFSNGLGSIGPLARVIIGNSEVVVRDEKVLITQEMAETSESRIHGPREVEREAGREITHPRNRSSEGRFGYLSETKKTLYSLCVRDIP